MKHYIGLSFLKTKLKIDCIDIINRKSSNDKSPQNFLTFVSETLLEENVTKHYERFPYISFLQKRYLEKNSYCNFPSDFKNVNKGNKINLKDTKCLKEEIEDFEHSQRGDSKEEFFKFQKVNSGKIYMNQHYFGKLSGFYHKINSSKGIDHVKKEIDFLDSKKWIDYKTKSIAVLFSLKDKRNNFYATFISIIFN